MYKKAYLSPVTDAIVVTAQGTMLTASHGDRQEDLNDVPDFDDDTELRTRGTKHDLWEDEEADEF